MIFIGNREPWVWGASKKVGFWKIFLVCIGRDVLTFTRLSVQATDAHSFYDLTTQRSINSEKQYEIEVGELVWIGRN